ncbi:MAG: hypothetical protein HY902_10535 [Deltaproteobacteria bacterium]|nr:hypothetical protein [Deltaproteobacteria bacterium]
MVVRCLVLIAAALVGCGVATPGPAKGADATDAAVTADLSPAPDVPAPDAEFDDVAPDAAPTGFCTDRGLKWLPFAGGPYGNLRHERAADFTLPLADETTWNFKDAHSGCEIYVFLTDLVPVSELNPASLWDSAKDLDVLIKKSPDNVHYFFLSLRPAAAAADHVAAMQERVVAAVAKLDGDAQTHWAGHLHVVATRGQDLDNWIGKAAMGHGQIGFVIDRFQRIRGFGNLSDVTRQKANQQAAGKWPWEGNLAYAAHEAVYLNAEAERELQAQADGALEVELWKGETLAEYATVEVDLGTADALAPYDTLQAEVEQRCPNDAEPELGNCGAWDYLARLSVWDGEQKKYWEFARFITSYHRETHWRVDASALAPLLSGGGKRLFRWDFAPSWNPQPTKTWIKLRFVNQGKPWRAKSAEFLWSGGSWGSGYGAAHPAKQVAVPATAKRVELWALITGHGQDPKTSCAEFCNHQHVFSVGSAQFTKDHPLAGASTQCIPSIAGGMVPNQAGTWWFGRGGWCPGMQVEPWIADVTSAAPPGSTAAVAYQALFKGSAPQDGQGSIDGAVWLVVYE